MASYDLVEKQVTLRAPVSRVWQAIANAQEFGKARDQVVADIFFALGDKTRLSVVKKLVAAGALSATASHGRGPIAYCSQARNS
jgi:hypothetical protein